MTPDMLRYLSALREVWPKGPAEAARLCGFPYTKIKYWRTEYPAFVAREKKERDRLHAAAVAQSVEEERAPRPSPLSGGARIFIDTWRLTCDRSQAWTDAGLMWDEIEALRASDATFAAEYAKVEAEINIRVKDAASRAAIAGNIAGINQHMKITEPANKGPKDDGRARRLAQRKAAVKR